MFLTVVVAPIGLIVILNMFIYFLTITAVVKYDTNHPSQQKSVYSQQATIKDVTTVVGLMLLFLIAMTLISLAFTGQDMVLQVFFATACIMYGFYAFALLILFSKEARKSWKDVFKAMKCKKKYGYDVKRLNKRKSSSVRDAGPSVTVISRNFLEEVRANPGAEEDTTFEDDEPVTTPFTIDRDDTASDTSSTTGRVYIEIASEINGYMVVEGSEEVVSETVSNNSTRNGSMNRLPEVSCKAFETNRQSEANELSEAIPLSEANLQLSEVNRMSKSSPVHVPNQIMSEHNQIVSQSSGVNQLPKSIPSFVANQIFNQPSEVNQSGSEAIELPKIDPETDQLSKADQLSKLTQMSMLDL